MDEYISIGYLLNNAARMAKRDLTNRMNDLGLTFPQWIVLKDLADYKDKDSHELTMAAIARRLNTNRPNIMGMLERLENLDLVHRAVNPDNRRAHIVTLTDKATEVLASLSELSKQTSAKALEGFTLQEDAAVKDYLVRIILNLNESDQEHDGEGRDNK